MAGMEALVAMRERLPILFVVFNDGRYNMVHHGMRQIFGEAAPYDTPPVDFAVWAASIGLPATVVSRPGELTARPRRRSLLQGGPALIDVRDRRQRRGFAAAVESRRFSTCRCSRKQAAGGM